MVLSVEAACSLKGISETDKFLSPAYLLHVFHLLSMKLGRIIHCILSSMKFKHYGSFDSFACFQRTVIPIGESLCIQMRILVFEHFPKSQTGQMFSKMSC